jgi:phenylacetate-CoA ligase
MFSNKYFHMLRLVKNERRPLDELYDAQNVKLRRLIHHAYRHVPFYRDRFKKIRLSPDDIRTADDLYKIPIIDKKDFHQSDVRDLVDQRIQKIEKLVTLHTSGSSGETLTFFADQSYNQLRKAQFLRPYITNGIGLFDRAVWFRSRPQKKRAFYQHVGIFRDHQIFSSLEPDLQIKLVQQIKPSVIKGYGSTLQLMASKMGEANMAVPSPRLIFTDSEFLSKESRLKIEQAFRSEIVDIYGTYETENVAYECHMHEGYHMAIDCVIMEFIKDGKQVKPGEEGEIVFTVLDNYAFPFIRYNIHDLASYKDTPCSCGRTFPLMGIVTGRTNVYAVKPNGDPVSSTTLIRHFRNSGKYIHEFQLIQELNDLFSVLIVPSNYYSGEIVTKIAECLQQDLAGATIRIHLVDEIKREESGKFQSFKSLIRR